jgi:hypothetical protein
VQAVTRTTNDAMHAGYILAPDAASTISRAQDSPIGKFNSPADRTLPLSGFDRNP